MNGKLIIEEEFLDSILDNLYELRTQLQHDKSFINILNTKISKVEVMLSNVKEYEVICSKCGIREVGGKKSPNF